MREVWSYIVFVPDLYDLGVGRNNQVQLLVEVK